MTAAEEGVLLLCSRLGDDSCKPLTMAQFRDLGDLVRNCGRRGDPLSELSCADLVEMGCSRENAERIVGLLGRKAQLRTYLSRGENFGIVPVTRVSACYPLKVSVKMRFRSSPVLYAMGELSLLDRPAVSVVGSRDLRPDNKLFAQQAGVCAAREGLVLVSGGAAGADTAAQEACLAAGGSCIVIVPDRLMDKTPRQNVLYLTEDGYDVGFSAARALRRNALIHILGEKTLVAQCTSGSGGTWKGSTENLKHHWSDLFVYDDGSEGNCRLIALGGIGVQKLDSITALQPSQDTFF